MQRLTERGLRVDGRLVEAFREALRLASLLLESGEGEWRGFMAGLDGGYVEPGPSGCLERGAVDVLPTGRNMYTLDPGKLPTRSAWVIGVRAAREALERARRLRGSYPETVGHVLWSIDAFKAGGEQLASILYMLGVRPRWGGGGRVEGLEPIPLSELGRPRIDVLVRISGIVRDALPNYIDLINEAVSMVVRLEEPPELNYPRKHFLELVERLGVDEEEAAARVWGDPEGAYGAGVNYAVYSSAWRSREDLGKVWARWSSTMYLKGGASRENPLLLLSQARRLGAIVRHHYTDEHDPTNCCCYYAYQGGMQALAESLGARPVSLVVDTTRPDSPEARTIGEELARVLHAKLLNDRWIDGMMRHGYRGASEIMKKIDHLYGWQATTRALPDEAWDRLAEKVLSRRVREWMLRVNPYALEEVTRRMLEAVERGLWRPGEEARKLLLDARMEVEAVLEEGMGEGMQGGEVVVYTPSDVPSWAREMRVVEEAWERLKRGG